jgi:uncharacterized protein (TIGR02246 family)
MKRLGMVVCVAAACAALSLAGNEEATIRQLLEQNAVAWTKNDPEAFAKILADDVLFTENGGVNDGRASVLEHVRADHANLESLTLTTEVQRIRVAGDMAWAYAIERAHLKPREGNPSTLKSHSIFVLEKREGRWWIVAHSLSARRERPAAGGE